MSSPENDSGSAWSKAASVYAKVMTGVSAPAADHLVRLAQPIPNNSYILEVGAGSGATTIAIAKEHPECKVLATDIASKMLDVIESWNLPNVSTQQVDAVELEHLGAQRYTHVFSTFMLQCTKTPMRVLAGMRHCLKDDGVIALGVWGERLDFYTVWEMACQSVDSTYVMPPPFEDPNAWRTTLELRQYLEEAGFVVEKYEDVVLPFPFSSAEVLVDYWMNSGNPLLEMMLKTWKSDLELLREPMRELVMREYGDGKDIKLSAALCTARKVSRTI